AGNDNARFIGEILQRLKHLRRYLVLGHYTLDGPCAVAKDGKDQFAALALVIKPALDSDGLTVMLSDFGNGGDGRLNRRCHLQISGFGRLPKLPKSPELPKLKGHVSRLLS